MEIDIGHRGALSKLGLLYEELNTEGIEFFGRLAQSNLSAKILVSSARREIDLVNPL